MVDSPHVPSQFAAVKEGPTPRSHHNKNGPRPSKKEACPARGDRTRRTSFGSSDCRVAPSMVVVLETGEELRGAVRVGTIAIALSDAQRRAESDGFKASSNMCIRMENSLYNPRSGANE